MSMIIYGPQGCGKTQHAEALRRHFKLARIVDGDDCRPNAYSLLNKPAEFQRGRTLYLTSLTPPPAAANAAVPSRLVLAFAAAMAQLRHAKA